MKRMLPLTCFHRRDLLGGVRDAHGLHGRGRAAGNAEVHLLRGGDVPSLSRPLPLPQVRLALHTFLEAVCGSVGSSLQSR